MTALLLYIMDQHRSMITIRHGMIDHYAERQHPAIMNLMVTSENNNRKIHLPRSRCVMSHRCKRNPRYTRYRRKGPVDPRKAAVEAAIARAKARKAEQQATQQDLASAAANDDPRKAAVAAAIARVQARKATQQAVNEE